MHACRHSVAAERPAPVQRHHPPQGRLPRCVALIRTPKAVVCVGKALVLRRWVAMALGSGAGSNASLMSVSLCAVGKSPCICSAKTRSVQERIHLSALSWLLQKRAVSTWVRRLSLLLQASRLIASSMGRRWHTARRCVHRRRPAHLVCPEFQPSVLLPLIWPAASQTP